jgi:two-component system, LytTR family, sensor kinase
LILLKGNYKYWGSQILGWFSLAALSIYFNDDVLFSKDFFSDIVFALVGLGVSHWARTFIFKDWWEQFNLEQMLFRLLAIVPAIGIIIGIIHLSILYALKALPQDYNIKLIFNFLLICIVVFCFWIMFYFIFKFVGRNRKLVIERLQMENSVKSLEIKTIKNNLQPHFIFNALNSIRALVDEDPARARQSITQLSNILRSSIQVNKVETVPLRKELEIVKDYLSLESIRYEERLQVSYIIADETLELPVPPMMLQTLAENAVKHGIAAHVDGGILNISSRINKDEHEISIINTGRFTPGQSKATTSDGFGLESTRSRLKFLFGPQAEMKIVNDSLHTVKLTLHIPFKK